MSGVIFKPQHLSKQSRADHLNLWQISFIQNIQKRNNMSCGQITGIWSQDIRFSNRQKEDSTLFVLDWETQTGDK